MLALAESYGSVDDRNLWPAGQQGGRSIGAALELGVRAAVTSQKKNPFGAWRYSPDAKDADTSVSGAVLVGLLAARNAGIDVPDEAIDHAVSYYQSMTSDSGQVAYSGGMGGFDESIARISIGSLVYSIARRKDLPQYKATLDYLKQRLEQPPSGYREYAPTTRPRPSSRATSKRGKSGTSSSCDNSKSGSSLTAVSPATSVRRLPPPCRCWRLP